LLQIFKDFKKANDSVRKDVSYIVLIEFSTPVKLLRLIKMCLNETYSTVPIGSHVSDMFPFKNGLKKEDAYHQCYQLCLEYTITRVQANQGLEIKWYISTPRLH